MWGSNDQGPDYFDYDWKSGSSKGKKRKLWPYVVIGILLLVVAAYII